MACYPSMKNPAQRRYLWRFFPTMTAYVILFATSDYLFHSRHISGPLSVILALAPALAILASIAVVGLYIAEEKDEFVRALFVRSMMWGIAGTLSFTTVRGFLEQFTPMDKFPLYAVYPLFWVVTGLAQAGHEFYYRRRND